MNMSDDIASASIQVSTKVAEAGTHAFEKTIDIIAKLLQMLAYKNQNSRSKEIKSTDLTDLKPGEVGIKELIASAKKNGDTISVSDNGFTKDDVRQIKKKAKEMGIPVSFTNVKGKDNIYANVRTSDLPIFQRICTEMMKDKIVANPDKLGNFKVQEWEMPFITNELNKHDLSATFGKTQGNEHFCLFDKADEKAILIARGEFVRKCNEINNEMSFDRDDEGNLTIKNLHTGKEILYDNSITRDELSLRIQEEFVYDKNKADLACAKFGEEMLSGEEKQRFFSDNPQNKFSKIDTNIKIEGESVLTQDYTCWRLTQKSDKVPQIVFRDDEGNFAVLDPNKMSRKQMSEAIQNELHITDKKTVDALVDKANKVHDYYSKQDEVNFSHDYKFSKSDFDMSNPNVVSDMKRTDDDGIIFTKQLPISEINNQIERNNKREFTVISTAKTMEINEHDEHYTRSDTQTLHLSFSDKRDSINQLKEIYQKQGVPEHIAKQMAKDVYAKAEAQSSEKVLHIEEVRSDSITVCYGWRAAEIDITDRYKAVEQIGRKFGVSDEEAELVLDKAMEKREQDHHPNTDEASESTKEHKGEHSKSSVKDNGEVEKRNGHENHKQNRSDINLDENIGNKENTPELKSSSIRRRK